MRDARGGGHRSRVHPAAAAQSRRSSSEWPASHGQNRLETQRTAGQRGHPSHITSHIIRCLTRSDSIYLIFVANELNQGRFRWSLSSPRKTIVGMACRRRARRRRGSCFPFRRFGFTDIFIHLKPVIILF